MEMTFNWFIKDGLNLRGARNLKNTPRGTFNCAGYALGTFAWYVPVGEGDGDDYCDPTIDVAIRTEMCVSTMLTEFAGSLRRISSISELTKNEYAIAFRMETNGTDFHYVKRYSNGRWYQKHGGMPNIEPMSVEEVFSSDWVYNGICETLHYDGPIVLLAKRR